MDVKHIRLEEYDYELPDERIAKYPLPIRDSSKLLIYNNKEISSSIFSSIADIFHNSPTFVFNNTKVIQARLLFRKSTGSLIEVFILNPLSPESYQDAFETTTGCVWNCVVGNLKKWKGETLELPIDGTGITLCAKMLERSPDGALVEFQWDRDKRISFAEIIESIGQVPIPPYLNREPIDADREAYQTVYAHLKGSVAAPTAGLHFTPTVLKNLQDAGCKFTYVTLHVGAGTFRPVKSDTIGEHDMHHEQILITKESLNSIIASLGNIVAVGTTSMRTLESLYWMGVKLIAGAIDPTRLVLNQWDAYQLKPTYSAKEPLEALLQFMEQKGCDYIRATTQMIIVPGYKFRVVNTLISNFHQPRSTLLLLVAAFIGEDWKRVYKYAMENGFRFLSYGDSSILFSGVNSL